MTTGQTHRTRTPRRPWTAPLLSERTQLAERRNRQEAKRLQLRKTMLDKQQAHAQFMLEKEKRSARSFFHSMKAETTGYSPEALVPRGPQDKFYAGSPYFAGGTLNERKFRNWRTAERHLERSDRLSATKLGAAGQQQVGHENIVKALQNILHMVGFTPDEIRAVIKCEKSSLKTKPLDSKTKSEKSESLVNSSTQYGTLQSVTEPGDSGRAAGHEPDDNRTTGEQATARPVHRIRPASSLPTRRFATTQPPDLAKVRPHTAHESGAGPLHSSDSESESSDDKHQPVLRLTQSRRHTVGPLSRRTAHVTANITDRRGSQLTVDLPHHGSTRDSALHLLRRLSTATGDRRLSMFQDVRPEHEAAHGQSTAEDSAHAHRSAFLVRQSMAIERKISQVREQGVAGVPQTEPDSDGEQVTSQEQQLSEFMASLPRWKRDLLREAPPALTNQEPLKVKLAISRAQRRRDLEQLMRNNMGDIRKIVSRERARQLQHRLSLFLSLYAAEESPQ